MVLVAATASLVLSSRADRPHVATIRTPVTRDSRVVSEPPFVLPDLSEYFTMLQRQHDTEVLAGIATFAAFLDSLQAVVQVPVVAPQSVTLGPVSAAGDGGRSDAWWAAIAQCESGTTNGWRTGYFGLEGRPGVSSLSYDEQLAIARGIYAQYGDGAWGCAGRAWAAVPSG